MMNLQLMIGWMKKKLTKKKIDTSKELFSENTPGWHKYRGQWRRAVEVKTINPEDSLDRFLIRVKVKAPKTRATYEYKKKLDREDSIDFLWG